jgi:hypothetical protein
LRSRILAREPARADTPANDPNTITGPVDVVLEVELALSPLDTRTQTYAQSKRVLDRKMRGKAVIELLEDAVANAELRMNFPQLAGSWLLYTYTVAEAKKGDRFQLPQNWVGKIWDPFLKDGKGILSNLGLENFVVSSIDNYEVSRSQGSTPHHTLPYHTIPYHTITYHTIPYRTQGTRQPPGSCPPPATRSAAARQVPVAKPVVAARVRHTPDKLRARARRMSGARRRKAERGHASTPLDHPLRARACAVGCVLRDCVRGRVRGRSEASRDSA